MLLSNFHWMSFSNLYGLYSNICEWHFWCEGTTVILNDPRFMVHYDKLSSTYTLKITDVQETDCANYQVSGRISTTVQAIITIFSPIHFVILMFTERVELWVSFRNRTLNLILYPFLKSACMFESLKQSLNIFAFFKFDKNRKNDFFF